MSDSSFFSLLMLDLRQTSDNYWKRIILFLESFWIPWYRALLI